MAEKIIKIDGFPKQIGLLAAALACLLAVFFAVKWCAANAMASNTIYREVADFAVSLAPADPQAHYADAVLLERDSTFADASKSVGEYERATALAPNDYRTWLALGKARERGGDAAGAESALKKARDLAPNYSEIGWILGNILLRENKREEAFAEMRRAAEGDRAFVDPTVTTAWQIFGGNLALIKQSLGDSAVVNSAFVVFLAREKRFDDALEIWNSFSAEQRKTTFKENGKILIEQMLAAGKYRAALTITAQTGEEGFAVGKMFNGGFEADVKPAGAGIFDWRIDGGTQPQILLDDQQKRGGSRSLVMLFNSATGREFRPVSQIIAVEPGARYAFESFYKSELKTAATVQWEIIDVASGKILAPLPPISAVSDWTNQRTEFVVPPDTEAVVVLLAREPCKSTLCPISGKVWFDDLSLSALQN